MGGTTRAPGIVPRGPGPSLLTAASRLPQGIDWRSGIEYRQTHCFAADQWAFCPGVDDEKPSPSGVGLADFYPFVGLVAAQCDWLLRINAEGEFDPETRSQLDAASAWLLSNELWTGLTNTGDSVNPSLQAPFPGAVDEFDETHIINSGGALNPVDAIGRLLAAYAAGTFVGGATLHVPLRLVPILVQNGTIDLTGQVLGVDGLAVVSPGPGYPDAGNTGPRVSGDTDGLPATAAQVWVYVTGPVEYEMAPVRLEPEQAESRWLDRRTNQYYVLAERQMIYRFDPCAIWAALITVPTAN
ncbi:MAG TPA: hypothetical protein VI916_02605 [Acidimicrobiia bacterium]|nr:hypothetical protein [Acidimicrobiia bacterium]